MLVGRRGRGWWEGELLVGQVSRAGRSRWLDHLHSERDGAA